MTAMKLDHLSCEHIVCAECDEPEFTTKVAKRVKALPNRKAPRPDLVEVKY